MKLLLFASFIPIIWTTLSENIKFLGHNHRHNMGSHPGPKSYLKHLKNHKKVKGIDILIEALIIPEEIQALKILIFQKLRFIFELQSKELWKILLRREWKHMLQSP